MNCAFFWEGNMYFYQKSKNRSKSFSFLSLFDKYRYAQSENNNKIKLWKTPCHIELHQMELYISLFKNGVNSNNADRTIYLTERTRISLVERRLQSISSTPKPPFLLISQNSQENENQLEINFDFNNHKEEMLSSSSTGTCTSNDDLDNYNSRFKNNLNEEQNVNDDYFYCSTFCEENDLILTADDENTVLELFVAIKSAFFTNEAISINDFTFISVLGRGNFGKVTLVQQKRSKNGEKVGVDGQFYALKSVHKMKLIKCNSIKTSLNERNILAHNKHPFIVTLKFAFQTATKFYLGMEFLSGGELRNIMTKAFTSFSGHHITFKDIQIYTAEIALALNHLHSNGVVYRDLKPENVMLSDDGHVKLTDFGLAEEIGPKGSTRSSCGTLEYIAPEVIRQSSYSFEVDWWSFGIVVYELIFHKTPFSDSNKGRLFARIMNDEIEFPDLDQNEQKKEEALKFSEGCLNVLDEINKNGFCVGLNDKVVGYGVIKDFLKKLLSKDPRKRLAFGKSFINHDFWGGLNFNDILQKKFEPTFVPSCSPSVENFNEKFTCEDPCDSFAAPPVGEKSVGINGFSFLGSSFICSNESNVDSVKAS